MADAPALDIITTFLLPGEVCMGSRQGPIGDRWIERIWVVRGDTIARYETDCGPAANFSKIAEVIIPGDGGTTVDEFRHEAERHRHDLRWWNHLQRVKAESTLIQDVNNQREARVEWLGNRSVFGPYHTVQRNIYNSAKTRRDFRDKRERATGKVILTPR